MPRTRSSAGVGNFSISVVGGAIMDLVYTIERMPENDESLDANSLAYKPGGKGSNTAIAIYRAQHKKPIDKAKAKPIDSPQATAVSVSTNGISRQDQAPYSVSVYLNTNVGEDEFGNTLKSSLRINGIDTTGIRKAKGQMTGTCAVFVNTFTKESRDIGYPGANTDWTPIESDSVRCLTGKDGEVPDLIVCHLETKLETVEAVLATAAKYGVETLLNPSPVSVIESRHYKNITHLIVNEKEAAELIPEDKVELKTIEEYKEAAKYFLSQGVKNVVITVGDKGAYYAINGSEGLVPPFKPRKIADMTGAGDTFVGYYAMEYVRQHQRKEGKEWDIRAAVELGCKAATRTIEEIGAQESIPWADELED